MASKKYLLRIVLFLIVGKIQSQSNEIDSLKSALNSAKSDTTKCNILAKLSEISSDQEFPVFNEQLMSLAEKKSVSSTGKEKKFYLKHIANALNNKGYLCNIQGRADESLDYFQKSLKIQKEIGDKSGMAYSLNNIGYVYNTQGQVARALEYYLQSLKIREEISDKRGIGESLANIAEVHLTQEDFNASLDYRKKSLKIYEEIGDKEGVASNLHNIGFIHSRLGKMHEALEYSKRSLKLYEEVDNKHGIALSLNAIGVLYKQQNNIKEALDYINRSLKIQQEIGDKDGVAGSLHNIGGIYAELGKLTEAYNYTSKSLELAKELGYPGNIERTAKLLSEIYEQQGKGMLALEMYKLHVLMKDSVKNEQNQKVAFRKEAQYKYEKQRAQDSVATAKGMELKNAQIEKQNTEISAKRNQQYFLVAGLVMVLIFSGFMYNRFKITQKQRDIIEQQKGIVENQKHIVEEKQKEILDSIRYAKRIQTALITNENYIEKSLKRLKV